MGYQTLGYVGNVKHRLNGRCFVYPPNSRSNSVGELPGISVVALLVSTVGAAADAAGSGLTCSAVTNNLLSAVPIGVQVSSVSIGLVVG